MSLIRIGKNIRFLVVLSVLQIIATIIFYHIITSILTESEIGMTATLTFVYSVLTVLSSLSLPIAGAKYVAEFIGKGKNESASGIAKLVVRLVLSSSTIIMLVFIIGLIFVMRVTNFSEITSFTLICLASFLASLKLTYISLVRGLQLFDKAAVANLSTTIVTYLLGVFLVFEYRLVGFSFGVFSGEIVGLVLAFNFYHGQLPKTEPWGNYKELLRFSIPIFVTQVVTIFSDWVDRMLFLAVSFNLGLLGVYDLAVKLSVSLLVIPGFVEALTLPLFSKSYSQTGEKRLIPLLHRALRYLGLMYFPVAFGLAAISRTIMTLLYGESYAQGGITLTILSLASIFVAFRSLLSCALKSIGKTKALIKISLASLLISVIIVVGLTPFIGIMGATLARVLSSFIVFSLIFYELKRWIKLEIDFEWLWKSILASLISAVLMLSFDMMHLSFTFVNLFLGIFFGIISYVFSLILLKALRVEDFQVFRQVLPLPTRLIDSIEKLIFKFLM